MCLIILFLAITIHACADTIEFDNSLYNSVSGTLLYLKDDTEPFLLPRLFRVIVEQEVRRQSFVGTDFASPKDEISQRINRSNSYAQFLGLDVERWPDPSDEMAALIRTLQDSSSGPKLN